MKIVIQIFICFLLIISCNKKSSKIETNSNPVLIKIGYYPSFHPSAETIFNLKEKYLIFYSPASYIPAPPMPSEANKEMSFEDKKHYKEYLDARPRLEPFKSSLNENDVKIIENISNGINSEDFTDSKVIPPYDGMFTNIIILYSDGKLIQVNPMNAPNENQRKFYKEILKILIAKNTNKSDSIILQKIKGYN